MAARRGVKEGAPDARARVHDAKVALGERGEPWWEPARVVDGERWCSRMPLVREVAAAMPDVVVLQRGEVVDPASARGPVRLGLSPAGASPPVRARRTRPG